jgi:hypothetical protein
MTMKDYTLLEGHLNSKWSKWYTAEEMVLEPPPYAPEWVKEHWQPMPKDYQTYGVSKSIECTPVNGALVLGGPQDGMIFHLGAHPPNVQIANEFKGLGLAQTVEIVGLYELEKQTFTFNGMHYSRMVYVFKPEKPPVKLKAPKYASSKKEVPEPPLYSPTKDKAWTGYKDIAEPEYVYDNALDPGSTPLHYQKKKAYMPSNWGPYLTTYPSPSYIDLEAKIEKSEEDLAVLQKNYEAYTMNLSKGTHTTATFDFTGLSPETVKLMYGQAIEPAPWDEPEEEDEPALWDQI